MYDHYFPSCPVDGPIEPPVPFGHLGLSGAVPNKCSSCKNLFEGECTRFVDEVGRYLQLDHGPCGIDGPTDPILFENDFVRSKVKIPRKCAGCRFLDLRPIFGFVCTKDREKWGDFHRGLDWGAWEPDSLYLQLPPPKVTSKKLSSFAKEDDLIEFIKEHRRINPRLSIEEARADFAHFRNILSDLSE